jgi:ribosomal-protein-alanine N-acetyltransferase
VRERGKVNAAPPLSTRLVTDRLVLRAPKTSDLPEIRRGMRRNAAHLAPWVSRALGGGDPNSITALSKSILSQRRAWRQGVQFAFAIFTREPEAPFIGKISLTQVCRGALQSAYLGYWIDRERQGTGLMTEAVKATLAFAFGPAGLHRVQINIMPRNAASRRIVDKLGIRSEGVAERYLEIAGSWEDHIMYAITAEEWPIAADLTQPELSRADT